MFALGMEANQEGLLLGYVPEKKNKKNPKHFRNFFKKTSFNLYENFKCKLTVSEGNCGNTTLSSMQKPQQYFNSSIPCEESLNLCTDTLYTQTLTQSEVLHYGLYSFPWTVSLRGFESFFFLLSIQPNDAVMKASPYRES